MAQQCAIDELLGLGYRYNLNTPERLRRLTPADVQATAEFIFSFPGDVTAVVTPAPAP
ncbi:MAG: hypothetical protein ACOX3F_07415 [Kiritimatiellia bacterium]